MDIAIVVEFVAKYIMLPLGTIVCSMGWHMFKKQDERMKDIESKIHEAEKNVLELKTEIRKDIQYVASDIKDIKEMLKGRNRRN